MFKRRKQQRWQSIYRQYTCIHASKIIVNQNWLTSNVSEHHFDGVDILLSGMPPPKLPSYLPRSSECVYCLHLCDSHPSCCTRGWPLPELADSWTLLFDHMLFEWNRDIIQVGYPSSVPLGILSWKRYTERNRNRNTIIHRRRDLTENESWFVVVVVHVNRYENKHVNIHVAQQQSWCMWLRESAGLLRCVSVCVSSRKNWVKCPRAIKPTKKPLPPTRYLSKCMQNKMVHHVLYN